MAARGVFLFLAALLLPFFSPSGGRAAEGPERPADFLVPAPKDSAQAYFFSLLQPSLGKLPRVGTVSPSYISGRGGAYALNRLGTLPGDGNSLSGVFFPAFTLQALKNNSVFSSDEVAPTVVLASVPVALWVKADGPLQTLADIVAAARVNPNSFMIAGTGSDTDHSTASALFDRAAGVRTVYLPGIDSLRNAATVVQGKADAAWGYALPAEFMPGLRAAAVASPARSSVLPGVPTFNEADIPLQVSLTVGIAVPASAGPAVRQRVSDFFMREVMGDSNFVRLIEGSGFTAEPVPYEGMEDFLKQRSEDAQKFLQEYEAAGS